ncbi:exopolysaccharide production repressor protein [Brucella sp. IR073]|uniref:exopolysaccharide production repressor protein n=1 Tax=unclassified Brucella TaxID=2632610 RepID=UPI003B97EC20
MRFPKFLAGMLGALIAFGITTYFMSNSLWTAVIDTLICAVIIQIGYFGAILFLVAREKAHSAKERNSRPSDGASSNEPSRPFKTSAPKAP